MAENGAHCIQMGSYGIEVLLQLRIFCAGPCGGDKAVQQVEEVVQALELIAESGVIGFGEGIRNAMLHRRGSP